MFGIVLMITGGIAVVAGLLLFISAKNQDADNSQKRDLNHIVKMAVAHGVITQKERNLITEISLEKGLNPESILLEVESLIKDDLEYPETEILDLSKKKGDDFEKYVVKKFDVKFFKLLDWASDKFIEGTYSISSLNPDMTWEFRIKDIRHKFAVECKWRSDFYKSKIEICSEDQLKRYKKYGDENEQPVFIVLGVGGKASNPNYLYLIPIDEMKETTVGPDFLKGFGKNREKNFYYDYKTKILN